MDAQHRPNDHLQRLLDFLAVHRLIDFSAYNQAMLARRIALRQSARCLPDLPAYHAFLQENPEEIDLLLDALSITVSHFFRNSLTFALLRERVIPSLFSSPDRGGGIRIWCAGCANGEEAYSIAILVHEYLKRESLSAPVLIMATDIEREALANGIRGWYRPEALEETRKRHLDLYFTPDNGGYQVQDEIRAMVTFAWHDLASGTVPQEGIFSDYQLILCRNVLIYFRRERGSLIQQQLAARLRPGGWLVLGEAETIPPELAGTLGEIASGSHIFRKEARHD